MFCVDTKRSMKIQHSDKGCSAYCFKCHAKEFKGHGLRPLNKLALFKATKEFCTKVVLPKDFTTEIPPKHAVWLYKAGIYKDTSELYGIGWSKALQRVILPIYRNSELIYMQSRAVIPGMKPKYLNKTAAGKANILFESKDSKHCLTNKIVVVTEDILSAIRTGVYVKSFSLLGTDCTDAVAYILSKYNALVVIWLDPDKAGVVAGPKVLKKLRSIGVNSVIYSGKEDPKYYTNAELMEIINAFDA